MLHMSFAITFMYSNHTSRGTLISIDNNCHMNDTINLRLQLPFCIQILVVHTDNIDNIET